MSLLLNVVGVLLGVGFLALSFVGAGLAVAAADALLDGRRKAADAHALRVMEGRWLAIRHYASWWAAGAAVWLATVLVLAAARGA